VNFGQNRFSLGGGVEVAKRDCMAKPFGQSHAETSLNVERCMLNVECFRTHGKGRDDGKARVKNSRNTFTPIFPLQSRRFSQN
jgi:hypothetical protein